MFRILERMGSNLPRGDHRVFSESLDHNLLGVRGVISSVYLRDFGRTPISSTFFILLYHININNDADSSPSFYMASSVLPVALHRDYTAYLNRTIIVCLWL